jgi:hypothetical protein
MTCSNQPEDDEGHLLYQMGKKTDQIGSIERVTGMVNCVD